MNIDTRRMVKYEYEEFDVSRVDNIDYILGQIASGTALGIEADLNSAFLTFLVTYFNVPANAKQTTTLNFLLADETADPTIEQYRSDLRKMKMKQAVLSKRFSKKELGVVESEFITLIAPEVRVNLEQCF
ncbi:MAG: hypothetical protein ACRCYA_04090 [Cetobacterium sp.]|uniref:hypothetical protein n=1 Tax=Cetobacterium sp. TaxID=2071632 RepID=UPI003F35E7F1